MILFINKQKRLLKIFKADSENNWKAFKLWICFKTRLCKSLQQGASSRGGDSAQGAGLSLFWCHEQCWDRFWFWLFWFRSGWYPWSQYCAYSVTVDDWPWVWTLIVRSFASWRLRQSLSSSHFMWTRGIHNPRRNPVGWGSSASCFEQEHFTSSFATPTGRLLPASRVLLSPLEANCFAAPRLGRQPCSPAATSTTSFDMSPCSRAISCLPLLYFYAALQNIPAECGLMGQAWHRK